MLIAAGAHLTYPHCSGFHGSDRVAVVRYDRDATRIVSVPWRGSGSPEVLHSLAPQAKPFWFDVSPTNRIGYVSGGALHVGDLGGAVTPVWRHDTMTLDDDLTGLSADGRRALVAAHDGHRHAGFEVDVATGTATTLYEVDWWANHLQYCRHDERWIGFSHEGPALDVPDRVWSWHGGRIARVLDQRAVSEDRSRFVAVGHEVWCRHDTAVLAVAYGDSEAGPRGLWLAYPDGRPARLVSPGNRYWHCDVSPGGRYAVVDTTGPADAPGRGWQNAAGVSDVLLVDLADGSTRHLARTAAANHPWHPHPVFSPDGSAVLYNHLGRGTVVCPL